MKESGEYLEKRECQGATGTCFEDAFTANTEDVLSVEINADGTRVVSASYSQFFRRWK